MDSKDISFLSSSEFFEGFNPVTSLSRDEPTYRSAPFHQEGTEFKSATLIAAPTPPHSFSTPKYLKGITNATESKSVEIVPSKKNRAFEKARDGWNVACEALCPVPSYYPLEKSSKRIKGVTANEISSSISECCKSMSVQAKYNNDDATALLLTPENVELHVSLWRGSKPKHKDCIIVQVQRTRGDALTFRKYRRAIIKSAASGEFDAQKFFESEDRKHACPATSPALPPGTSMNCESKTEKNFVKKQKMVADRDESIFALELANGLLEKDRIDARQLALESLSLLTDADKTGIETCLMACRSVLLGSPLRVSSLEHHDPVLPEGLRIREVIICLIQFGRWEQNMCMEKMEGNEDDEYPEDARYNEILQNMALKVLANALSFLGGEHGGRVAIEDGDEPCDVVERFMNDAQEMCCGHDILESLVGMLGNAWKRPHDACLSASCIKCVCKMSKGTKERTVGLNSKKLMDCALEVGHLTHSKLENEVEGVMRVLEGSDVKAF